MVRLGTVVLCADLTTPPEKFVSPSMKFQYVFIELSQHLLKPLIIFESCRQLVKARHSLANHGISIDELIQGGQVGLGYLPSQVISERSDRKIGY